MRASIKLTPAQALDVAALAYAAGDADDPADLQEMLIRIPNGQQVNYVTFSVTDRYVAATRRGTYGEFGGEVEGEGVFSINARRFARLLRLAVKEMSEKDLFLRFLDSDGLEINGRNVGLAYHPSAEIYARRINEITDKALDLNEFEQDYEGGLPAFNMQLLSKLTRATNVTIDQRMNPMRMRYVDRNRWAFVTPYRDSWQFAGVILEYTL